MSSVGSAGSSSVSLPATTLGVVPYNLIRGTSSTRVPDTAACMAASVRELEIRTAHDIATRIVPIPAMHLRRMSLLQLLSPTIEAFGNRGRQNFILKADTTSPAHRETGHES